MPLNPVKIDPEDLCKDLQTIRQTSPLIHNITNYVVMNNTANALLALGASPVMAHAVEEVEDMVNLAGALVLNIGTLSPAWVEAMFKAAKKAGEKGIPVILDPVGVGATPYRTRTALDLARETHPSIIRGNASEIMALAQAGATTKGVDSTSSSDHALESARNLTVEFDTVVCITGRIDYIVDKDQQTIEVTNGHEIMPRVTGLGCTATALCGAFSAVNSDFPKAAAHAMAIMGIAGEMSGKTAKGPGSFQVGFIDALYRISAQEIGHHLKP
ncbi:MAG: hydroxyethylthiazole kinase [Desulfobacterium sp.]|nr:hydroxyethylthiazole kinase [Desulfobacterium sp.]